MRGMMAHQHVNDAEEKGRRNSCQSHIQGSPAHTDQVFGLCLQANGKQQEDRSNTRYGIDGVRGDYQTRAIRPKEYAGKNFAQNCRQVHPLKGFAKEFGPHEDEEQLKKKWISSMHGTWFFGCRDPGENLIS